MRLYPPTRTKASAGCNPLHFTQWIWYKDSTFCLTSKVTHSNAALKFGCRLGGASIPFTSTPLDSNRHRLLSFFFAQPQSQPHGFPRTGRETDYWLTRVRLDELADNIPCLARPILVPNIHRRVSIRGNLTVSLYSNLELAKMLPQMGTHGEFEKCFLLVSRNPECSCLRFSIFFLRPPQSVAVELPNFPPFQKMYSSQKPTMTAPERTVKVAELVISIALGFRFFI